MAKKDEVAIQVPDAVKNGKYANAYNIVVSDTDAMIDFALVLPTGTSEKCGEVVSRIFIPSDLALKLRDSFIEVLNKQTKKTND